jgi:hypothetical protein
MTSGRQKIPAQHFFLLLFYFSSAREGSGDLLGGPLLLLRAWSLSSRETHYMMIRNPATHFIRSARFAFLHSSSAGWALLFFVVFLASSSLLNFERRLWRRPFCYYSQSLEENKNKKGFQYIFFGGYTKLCVCVLLSFRWAHFFLPKLGNKRRKMVMKRLRERPASSSLLHLATTSGCFMATTSRGDVKAPQPHVLCAVYIYSKS